MKKIINNKVYDTNTAVLVGSWSNGCYRNDFDYCSEDLYRKKTGEFFLYGDGGARSKYSTMSGGSWSGSEKIMPMTYQSAKEWAQQKLSTQDYEKIFGEIEEDESNIRVTISLTASAHGRLKQAASKQSVTVSALIEEFANNLKND